MQRYPEKSSIISYLFCAVITTLEAKSKLNGWKIRSMTNNGGGMRSWRSDESLTSPTETEVGTRFDLSNPHKPSHDLYHVLAFRTLFY